MPPPGPLASLIAAAAPPRCGACGGVCGPSDELCSVCAAEIRRARAGVAAGPPGIDLSVSAASYEGAARLLAHGLKYGRRTGLAAVAAVAPRDACPPGELDGVVAPVPAAPGAGAGAASTRPRSSRSPSPARPGSISVRACGAGVGRGRSAGRAASASPSRRRSRCAAARRPGRCCSSTTSTRPARRCARPRGPFAPAGRRGSSRSSSRARARADGRTGSFRWALIRGYDSAPPGKEAVREDRDPGVNVEVDDELREAVTSRFARVGKQVSDLAMLEVELSEERNPRITDKMVAEATLRVKGEDTSRQGGLARRCCTRSTSSPRTSGGR